jgi:hypothetical protein
VSRALHKVWQSDRPLKPSSRRVKFYKAPEGVTTRLEFMDAHGKVNCYYDTPEEAQAAYEQFRDDEDLTTNELRNSAAAEER